MSIEFSKLPKTEYQYNVELLKQEDESFVKAYELAVNADPRLADVIIHSNEENDQTDLTKEFRPSYFAEKPWETESGKPEIYVLLAGGDKSILSYQIDEGSVGLEQMVSLANSVDIHNFDPAKNVKLFKVFMLLHELGHAKDFFDNMDKSDDYDKVVEKAWQEWNVPYKKYVDKRNNLFQKWNAEYMATVANISSFANREDYAAALDNVCSKYEIVMKNIVTPDPKEMDRKYVEMPHEKFADNFAKKTLTNNPDFLMSLINN